MGRKAQAKRLLVTHFLGRAWCRVGPGGVDPRVRGRGELWLPPAPSTRSERPPQPTRMVALGPRSGYSRVMLVVTTRFLGESHGKTHEGRTGIGRVRGPHRGADLRQAPRRGRGSSRGSWGGPSSPAAGCMTVSAAPRSRQAAGGQEASGGCDRRVRRDPLGHDLADRRGQVAAVSQGPGEAAQRGGFRRLVVLAGLGEPWPWPPPMICARRFSTLCSEARRSSSTPLPPPPTTTETPGAPLSAGIASPDLGAGRSIVAHVSVPGRG